MKVAIPANRGRSFPEIGRYDLGLLLIWESGNKISIMRVFYRWRESVKAMTLFVLILYQLKIVISYKHKTII